MKTEKYLFYEWIKKYALTMIGCMLLLLCLFGVFKLFQEISRLNKTATYCGTVVEKFRTDAGYKSSPQAHIVFYCDSLHRNVDVQVTWNCYANVETGKSVCFELRNRDIEN